MWVLLALPWVELRFGWWEDWKDRELLVSDGTAELEMLKAAETQSASFALLALSSWVDPAFYVALREVVWAQPEGRGGTTVGCS